MPEFTSFAQALMAFFSPPRPTVAEVRALTPTDRSELSVMLNAAGFTHPAYQAA